MLTSKQRAYLSSLANNLETILYIGKESLGPAVTKNVDEALTKRELVKVGMQKACADDPREIAQMLAERTRSEVVRVIGKKIILYREGEEENKNIVLPKGKGTR